jgi:hypothetical protein
MENNLGEVKASLKCPLYKRYCECPINLSFYCISLIQEDLQKQYIEQRKQQEWTKFKVIKSCSFEITTPDEDHDTLIIVHVIPTAQCQNSFFAVELGRENQLFLDCRRTDLHG